MVQILSQFINTYINYIDELWLSLLIGFLLSGIFNECVSTKYVEKYLGKNGFKPIFISTFVGMLLPVCCLGSLPIAVTLRRKGASLGPVLAFLIATPATSISALVVCWKLLGANFTFFIFLAVIMMGLIVGYIGNILRVPLFNRTEAENCCRESEGFVHPQSSDSMGDKLKNIFRYAFLTLPKSIGLELLLGIALACLIMILAPVQHFIQQFLTGMFGYIFVLLFGLVTYVCSTASVPMADAFLKSGMGAGQAMTYLLIGPITSYGALLVLHKEFGRKILALYLFLIPVLSLLFGLLYQIIS